MTGDDPRPAARTHSGGTADHGSQGAVAPPGTPSGESRPADVQDAGGQDYAGTPRPDAVIPALDAGQLAALRRSGASGTG